MFLIKNYWKQKNNGSLLYLNLDFGTGCTLDCPHCFTQEGAIDNRGRDILPYDLFKERILEAKELGLKAVRILGRGEPTQWVYNEMQKPRKGEDFFDFVKFLNINDIIPVVFTRGQIIGDDDAIKKFYDGKHGINTGKDIVDFLKEQNVSVFFGLSSIFPEINDEMVGRGLQRNYDPICRNALKMLIKAGFNCENPTHLAIESPITNLNIYEMPARYIMFQLLNISPCVNVYMVTGRAMTYNLGEITDPSQNDFINMYATIIYFMKRMGIKEELGAYAGTKGCHDVSYGLYITLNGDIYPCPGYENIQSYVGNIRDFSIKKVWENNPYARHAQSICPPKIGTHFPPRFRENIENTVEKNSDLYEEMFVEICKGLGVPGV